MNVLVSDLKEILYYAPVFTIKKEGQHEESFACADFHL